MIGPVTTRPTTSMRTAPLPVELHALSGPKPISQLDDAGDAASEGCRRDQALIERTMIDWLEPS